jgi:predicted DNA-binding protein
MSNRTRIKSKIIALRLTEDEYTRLKELREKTGYNFSQKLRNSLTVHLNIAAKQLVEHQESTKE